MHNLTVEAARGASNIRHEDNDNGRPSANDPKNVFLFSFFLFFCSICEAGAVKL